MAMFQKVEKTIGAAAFLAFGFVAEAAAAPTFSVDPSAIPGVTFTDFTATGFAHSGSTKLQFNPGSFETGTGTGWLRIDQFTGANVGSTGVGNDYTVWGEFNYEVTLVPGTGPGGLDAGVYHITSMDIDYYGVEGVWSGSTAFIQADAATNTAASVDTSQFSGGPIVSLATATVSSAPQYNTFGNGDFNSITVTAGGGAGFNATFDFFDVNAGFFFDPVPFYDLAFASVTNDSGQVELANNSLYIQNSGTSSFAKVPEPGTLGLIGLGLLGAGWASRRRGKNAKVA